MYLSVKALDLVSTAQLTRGNTHLQLIGPTSNSTLVKGSVKLDAKVPLGKYDLEVTTSDGKSARLNDAFEVKEPGAS